MFIKGLGPRQGEVRATYGAEAFDDAADERPAVEDMMLAVS